MKLHLIAKVNKTADSGANDASEKLKKLVEEDQAERNEYYKELLLAESWKEAAKQWCKKKNRSEDNVFNDAERLKEAKELIKANQDSINPNDVWVLVQHSDKDPEFQKWFLDTYKDKLKVETTHYLEDRWLVNTGQPPKHNTQNEEYQAR